jgi:hypothetical protein
LTELELQLSGATAAGDVDLSGFSVLPRITVYF